MKFYYKILFFVITSCCFTVSCTDNDDDLYKNNNTEVQNFIWKGLNNYYLWQQNVPDLADNRFVSPYQLNDFVTFKGTPENLFVELLYKPKAKFVAPGQAVDKYSILVNDYEFLENLFQGTRKTSGIVAGYKYRNGFAGPIFGYVEYVLPNSDAENKNLKRGDVFYAVNGTTLTFENRSSLFANDNFSLDLANLVNGNVVPNGQTVALTKSQITENPVYLTKTFTYGTKKIGYLMYNAFTANFNQQLNDAFAQLAGNNVTDLVLDLRYNGGGSIQTATYLASMITGQFNNQIFATQQWNQRIQTFLQTNYPDDLQSRFTNNMRGVAINSLNLSKVYILTTDQTASASELVINGLKPYIDVVQIGTTTIGKNAGSITLYDSPNFTKTDVNRNHKYAMQPLVLKIANKNGFGEYENGLSPDSNNVLPENIGNLKVLGAANEPLLKKAIDLITARTRPNAQNNFKIFSSVTINNEDYKNEMYLDQLSTNFLRILK